jgi:Methyltransferase domain
VGRIEAPPLQPGEADVLLLSQSLHCVADPAAALLACHAALAPGARIIVIDLAPHAHGWVRERLGHVHLGFAALGAMLTEAGFQQVDERVVHRDRVAPAFVTTMAVGRR